jgi:hypothetical protein
MDPERTPPSRTYAPRRRSIWRSRQPPLSPRRFPAGYRNYIKASGEPCGCRSAQSPDARSCGEAFPRHDQPDDETLRFPIPMNVSVKAFDGGSNENAAKTLLAEGQATGGPPCSDQVTFILPACSSQWISMRPPRMERAPYFAALVANSCSSSASSEMTFPEISTSLPVIEKRLDISCSWCRTAVNRGTRPNCAVHSHLIWDKTQQSVSN